MMASNNPNIDYSRLCLKNIPSHMTKDQIKSRFFKSLDKVEVFFPKKLFEQETRIGFVQLGSDNEGKLAKEIVNMIDFNHIEAYFATKIEGRGSKTSLKSQRSYSYSEDSSTNSCSFCGLPESQFICAGCCTAFNGTFYCSEEHQAQDWPKHKIVCKPLPALKIAKDHFINGENSECAMVVKKENTKKKEIVNDSEDSDENENIRETAKYFIQYAEMPKVGDKVIITSIVNPRVLYIRQNSEEYKKLVDKIKMYSSKSANITSKPEVNTYVLASTNGSYHRAKIQDVFESDSNGCNVKVFFVDYGTEKKLRWQDLKSLSYRLRGLPTYTFKVILDGVKVNVPNQKIQEYLYSFYFKSDALEIREINVNHSGERKVKLFDIRTGKTLNERINEIEIACLAASNFLDSSDRVFYDHEKIPQILTGAGVSVRIIDSSLLEVTKTVACMPDEKFTDYINLYNDIKNFAKKISNESYKPFLNELCLVKFKNNWHRAVVLRLCDADADQVEIALLDKFISAKVSYSEIRKIPRIFTNQLFTSLCYVEGIDNRNIEEAKRVLVPGVVKMNVNFDRESRCPVLSFPSISLHNINRS